MKKVSGTLKLDQAQYRELEAFAKFGSDLDPATMNIIEKGKRNVEILKQSQSNPYSVEKQIAIIYAGINDLLKNIPVQKIKEFEKVYIEYLEFNKKEILDNFKSGKLEKEDLTELQNVISTLEKEFITKE